ncbi:hypothetical protein SteCoe_8295 [Stentor coeruleus]|uniref:PA domain-containing protein n=1 Tax=Stentor coeruleus TaxID=5963 RepID=A0A1R2CKN1_9CILI|nr:hypothetical protein SteCoe_8295 [Stentor coeruleus]
MLIRLTAFLTIFIRVISQASDIFRILSPDKLNNNYLNITIATFGNPSYMPRYGHIMLQKSNKACTSEEIFDNITFVATSLTKYCNPKTLARTFQEAGAAGVIFFLSDSTWNYLQIAPNPNDTIEIPVFGIESLYSKIFESVTKSPIWVMYQYPLNIHEDSSINLVIYFTHNYTLDIYFIKEYLNLYISEPCAISYKFAYLNETHELINSTENDCKKKSNQKKMYCLPSIGNVTGEERVINSLYLSALREEIEDINTFFEVVASILEICEMDYTEECMKKATKRVFGKTISPDILNNDYWESQKALVSKYLVNSQEIFWPEHLQEAVLLSRKEQAYPKTCKGECFFSYLFDQNAHCSRCNNSECGYNNMRCLQAESQPLETCYIFMLGDGTCNEPCLNDPDCQITITLDTNSQIIYYIFIPVISVVTIYWIIIAVIFYRKTNHQNYNKDENKSLSLDVEESQNQTIIYYEQMENKKFERFCFNCHSEIKDHHFVERIDNKFCHSKNCQNLTSRIPRTPRTPNIIEDDSSIDEETKSYIIKK